MQSNESFMELLSVLIKSNGRGHLELQKRIKQGVLTEEEAALLMAKAAMSRVESKYCELNSTLDMIPEPG